MRQVEYKGKQHAVSDAHRAADALPWNLDDAEFAATVESMVTDGFDPDRPVTRLVGTTLIIDGRRRELAAAIAGVEPVYRTVNWTEEQVVRWVERDLNRRNITASQRAASAVELASLYPRGGDQKAKGNRFPLARTSSDISSEIGVSEKTVDAAAKVKKKAPELLTAVKEGDLSAKVAAKVADLPKQERATVAKAKDKKKAAKAALAKKPNPGDSITLTAEDEKAELAKRAVTVIKDALGVVVPPGLRDTFGDPELTAAITELDHLLGVLDERYQLVIRSLSRKPYKFCDFGKVSDKLSQIVHPTKGLLPQVISHLRAGVPYAVCACGGDEPAHKDCRCSGYLPKWRHDELSGKEVVHCD